MLTKFETKSNRVKGLSFHPTRPWILASLHSGIIQLWDYRIRTLIEKFDEHDGPVRGVCFHLSQPLFVSGGDDYKIKVWNYKLRRCLFTLLGHLDYIRTVQFHHELPWILSSSDDQIIRIWNWQSRQCISALTGHNHYVMSALFHPRENLVVSASLDQTVRVWDISGLRKKNYTPGGGDDLSQNDLFGNTDVAVTHILEGHDRGVNWAAFHKSSLLVVSAADDRLIKFWRLTDPKPCEVDTLRGHYNNVSSVLFHPTLDLILSNSEDNTIRVWDMQKRSTIRTYRREHDRFWMIAGHPEQNLFAAGHDSGLIVFKLEHERPAYTTHGKYLFYIKERSLRVCDLSNGKERVSLTIRRSSAPLSGQPRQLHYNPAENSVLVITEDSDSNNYELYQLPAEGAKADSKLDDSKRGQGKNAVWIARNRFVVLDKHKKLLIKNLQNQTSKTITSSAFVAAENIFAAGTGTILVAEEDKISLFDLQQQTVLATIKAVHVKMAIWSETGADALVALVGRDSIIIADRNLQQKARILDTRVKSGAWHENGVFIYTTLNHIKYTLPNGDNGIIRTLDVPIYITAVKGDKIYCLDRSCRCRVLPVDITEFVFKLALIQKNYAQVLKMVRESDLIGLSIIAYLQRKGYPEVALHFVKDQKTRFNLALECGNIDVALEAALAVDDRDCWHRLATEALRQGNHQVVEMAYQRTKNYERLSFLYLITGNIDKLQKMLKIAERRNDIMSRFHNALFLGDVDDRIEVLLQSGQANLAFYTASAHGLEAKAQAIAQRLQEANLPVPDLSFLPSSASASSRKLLVPPTPILPLSQSNWPLLTTSVGIMQTMLNSKPGTVSSAASSSLASASVDEALSSAGGAWGDDLVIPDGSEGDLSSGGAVSSSSLEGEDAGEGGEGWDGMELEGLENIAVPKSSSVSSGDNFFVAPRPGPSHGEIWSRNSRLVADHIAAGALDSAMGLLRQQIGAISFAPLKPLFEKIFLASQVTVPGVLQLPSTVSGIDRNWTETPKSRLPVNPFSLPPLIQELQLNYKSVTEGKFSEALKKFVEILHSIIVVSISSRQEQVEVKDLISICRHYITSMQMELKRRDADPVRQCELAAYFTHCSLQPTHTSLSLRSAMGIAFKAQNFKMAASFARRLLEFNPPAALMTQAKKVIAHADSNPTDQLTVNYDERNPFVVCCGSFTPIYKGSQMSRCPFCLACYQPSFKGQVCSVCLVSEIGAEAQGLELLPSAK